MQKMQTPEKHTLERSLVVCCCRRSPAYRGRYSYGREQVQNDNVTDAIYLVYEPECHLLMNKELRTAWQYCNVMFIAVSHMIETVTGEWLGDIFRKTLWEPLGMTSTFFTQKDPKAFAKEHPGSNLATGYTWDEDSSSFKSVEHWELPVVSGARHTISTVQDYSKYLKCMINKTQPLSEKGHMELTNPEWWPLMSTIPISRDPSPMPLAG